MPISPKSRPDFFQNLPLPPFEADQAVSRRCQAKTHHSCPKRCLQIKRFSTFSTFSASQRTWHWYMPTFNSSVHHFVLTGFPDCPGSPMGPREPGKPFNTKESDRKGMIFCK